jgi:catechol 2,3-dioxygenase-like lactoylglutathione lyase family enzyme
MQQGEFRFVFHAKDYEASVAFYRDALELEVASAWDRGPGDRGTLFQAASGIIEVMSLPGLPDPDAASDYVPPHGVSVMIETDDVVAFHSRCEANGLPIEEPIADQPWGHRRFVLSDPDGLRLCFFGEIE